MQRASGLSIGIASLLTLGCTQSAEQKVAEAPATTTSAFRPAASFKDIMAAEINTSATYLWNAVSSVSTENGVEDRQPRTDDDWLAAKHQAVILTEATNLLLIEGRPVVNAGDKIQDADLPGINSPDQIRKAIENDRASYEKLLHALHDAGMEAMKAINDKNAMALSDAGAKIDTACENCHLKYWYPPAAKAGAASSGTTSSESAATH